jgi:hypothetical protein
VAGLNTSKTVNSLKVLDKTFNQDLVADENHSDVVTVGKAAADLELDLFPSGEVVTGVFLVIYTNQPLTIKLTVDTNPSIDVESLFVMTGDIQKIFITVPGSVDAEVHIIAGGNNT